jgi:hypothetical protein
LKICKYNCRLPQDNLKSRKSRKIPNQEQPRILREIFLLEDQNQMWFRNFPFLNFLWYIINEPNMLILLERNWVTSMNYMKSLEITKKIKSGNYSISKMEWNFLSMLINPLQLATFLWDVKSLIENLKKIFISSRFAFHHHFGYSDVSCNDHLHKMWHIFHRPCRCILFIYAGSLFPKIQKQKNNWTHCIKIR